jgi:hypothetical protein
MLVAIAFERVLGPTEVACHVETLRALVLPLAKIIDSDLGL